jgi:hypothetical protein
MSDKLRTIES